MSSLRSLIPFSAVSLLLVLVGGCDGLSSSGSEDWRAEVERYRALGDYTAAAIEVKNALKVAPKDAEIRMLLGQLQIKQRDFAGAEKELKRALSLGARLEDVAPLLADAYFYQRKWQELLDEIPAESVGDESREWTDLQLKRAVAYSQSDQSDQSKQAVRTYNAVLDARPGNADALLGLGALALQEPDLIKAEGLLSAAMKAAPADSRVWLQIGKLRYQQHRYDDAILSYKRALKRNTAPDEVRIGLAWAYMAKERLDMVRKEAMAVRKRNVNHPMANYLLAALAFKEGDNRKAQDYLSFAMKHGGHRAQTILLAAANDQALGNYIQAEAQLRDFLESNPDYLPAQAALAEVLHAQGRSRVAFEGLQSAARRLGNEQAVAIDLAMLALKNNKPNEAKAYLESAIAAGDTRPEVLAAKGKLDQGFMHRALAILENMAEPVPSVEQDKAPTLEKEQIKELSEVMASGRYAEAENMARRLTAKLPDSLEAHNLLGAALAAQQKYGEARQSFNRAVALQPNVPEAVVNLFNLEMALKDYDAAGKMLDKRIDKFPLDIKLLSSRAQVAMFQGKPEESIRWLKRVLDADPVAVPARVNMARLYLSLDNTKAARTVIAKAYRTSPGNADVLELMGQVADSMGEGLRAEEYYQKLVDAAPDRTSGYERLTALQFKQEDMAGAKQTLLSLLDVDPQNGWAAASLVSLYQTEGSADEALAVARKYRQSWPESSVGYALEAGLLFADGKNSDAAALYDKAYAIAPSLALARAGYAARARSGEAAKGIVLLQGWVANNPDDVQGYIALSSAYQRSGDIAKARQQLLTVLDKQRENAVALNNLSNLGAESGNRRQALDYAQRANRSAPGNPAIADTLGWLLLSSGKAGAALPHLERAVSGLSSSPEVNFHLASALAKLDRKQDALNYLRRALDGGQDFPGKAEAEKLQAELVR